MFETTIKFTWLDLFVSTTVQLKPIFTCDFAKREDVEKPEMPHLHGACMGQMQSGREFSSLKEIASWFQTLRRGMPDYI